MLMPRPSTALSTLLHPPHIAALPPCPVDIYKAACNVWSRYAHIVEQHADIVAAARAAHYSGASINITEDARPRMAKLHKVNQVLGAAQLRLDDQAALFSDFSAMD